MLDTVAQFRCECGHSYSWDVRGDSGSRAIGERCSCGRSYVATFPRNRFAGVLDVTPGHTDVTVHRLEQLIMDESARQAAPDDPEEQCIRRLAASHFLMWSRRRPWRWLPYWIQAAVFNEFVMLRGLRARGARIT